jgi:hypothetical protein
MRLYNTVNDILSETLQLYRNVTGRQTMTAVETDIVLSSVIDAYQLVLLEYGVATFTFHEQTFEIDTVPGQDFVDLEEFVFRVVTGTVRIIDRTTSLGLIDEEKIYQADPGADADGIPYAYAYTGSDDPNVMRLTLWPIPDQAYTLTMKVLKLPTDTITNFPTTLMSAIKNKAKELAVVSLGMPQLKGSFRALYEEVIAKIKDGYDGDGPRHVQRRQFTESYRSIEERIPE